MWLYIRNCIILSDADITDTFVLLFPAVMDISDIIKGKVECDEEKQYFIPFCPYVTFSSSLLSPCS